MHVQDFIKGAKPLAVEVQKKFGIPWGVAVAQSALETGWGQHVRGNNYFGIKGQGQEFLTHEYVNGKRINIVDSFRAYESMEDSFMDYGLFLTRNKRYAACFLYKDEPERFAEELQRAGYATDPKYAAKLKNIMSRWNLEPLHFEEEEEEEAVFCDVSPDHWAAEAIMEVSRLGIMGGRKEGQFEPSEIVTRAELAVVISRLLERLG